MNKKTMTLTKTKKFTKKRPTTKRRAGSVQRVVRARLIRLKIGETTKYGDWCCNERDAQQPVEITSGSWEITAKHHPVYRMVAQYENYS